MKRRHISKRASRRNFKKHAKVKRLNLRAMPRRGGFRL